jgi:hypothetical protein
MQKWLKKMQEKPENQRRSFALFVSLVFTLIISAVWLSTILTGNNSTSQLAGSIPLEEVSEPIESLRSMTESFTTSISKFMNEYRW